MNKSARRGEPKISDGILTSAALSADTLLKELVTKISALTTESHQSASVPLTSARISCDYSKATSHKEEQCRKKGYDVKICDYCNIRGHTHGECFALSRAIKEGLLTSEQLITP